MFYNANLRPAFAFTRTRSGHLRDCSLGSEEIFPGH